MDEYEYDEGSDVDNWEAEQVFQDREGVDDENEPEDDWEDEYDEALDELTDFHNGYVI